MMDSSKESSSKKINSGDLAKRLESLIERVEAMCADIEGLKLTVKNNNNPVSIGSRVNCNTDPGPWKNGGVVKK